MKKRTRIFSLLEKYSKLSEYAATVTIKGLQTGKELYNGGIFGVPYGLCSDYVFSSEFDAESKHLEITSTALPWF